jgi:hypothetical protein
MAVIPTLVATANSSGNLDGEKLAAVIGQIKIPLHSPNQKNFQQ